MKKILFALAIAAALAASMFAHAQSSGNVQAVTPLTADPGKIITFSSTGASTVNSADQSGFGYARVFCTFYASSQTGSPSSTFKIQNKDAGSGQYVDVVTSSAITGATPTGLSAGAGVYTTANVGAGIPLARTWRVSVTIGGTATPVLVGGGIGCSRS